MRSERCGSERDSRWPVRRRWLDHAGAARRADRRRRRAATLLATALGILALCAVRVFVPAPKVASAERASQPPARSAATTLPAEPAGVPPAVETSSTREAVPAPPYPWAPPATVVAAQERLRRPCASLELVDLPFAEAISRLVERTGQPVAIHEALAVSRLTLRLPEACLALHLDLICEVSELEWAVGEDGVVHVGGPETEELEAAWLRSEKDWQRLESSPPASPRPAGLQDLRDRLERTPLEFAVDDVPLDQAAMRLTEASDIPVTVDAEAATAGMPRITLRRYGRTAAEVLDELAALAGLAPVRRGNGILLTSPDEAARVAAEAACCKGEADRVLDRPVLFERDRLAPWELRALVEASTGMPLSTPESVWQAGSLVVPPGRWRAEDALAWIAEHNRLGWTLAPDGFRIYPAR